MSTLTAYRVPPLHEWKAARELREAGIKAYVPRDHAAKRRAPVARGYVFSASKPAFAKHVRDRVGAVTTAELARLYLKRQRRAAEPDAQFKTGQRVEIKVGIFASMTGVLFKKRGRRQWLVSIGEKQVCAQTASLIRIDPG